MHLTRFDRIALISIACLVGLLAVVWGVWQFAGVTPPGPEQSSPEVGVRGPLVVRFDLPVDHINAQKHIHFDPLLVGNYTWVGDTAYFWPLEPLIPGNNYTIRVDAGIQTTDARTVAKGSEWQVQVREPGVVFQSPSRAPEIWLVDPGTGKRTQLTQTGGRVFDFAVAPDGESLAYSQYDDQGGISLWSVNRDGGSPKLLLDCGADWCVNPTFSPDGLKLAYARRLSGGVQGSSPGVPRVWTLDLSSLQTDRLYTDPNIGGSEPAWSPDGRYLAFFDGINNGLRLANLETHQDSLLPSEMGMTARWSPDGLSLYFTNIVSAEAFAYENVYRYAIPTRQTNPAFGPETQPMDYSPVAFSADGQWLVVGIRDITGSPARQMWLMRTDGSQRSQITQDPLVNASAFHWNPAGDQVVYQSLALGSSNAVPQVMLWDRAGGDIRQLGDDATRPAWIP